MMPAEPPADDGPSPSDEQLVERILDAWDERGGTALEDACRAHPERAEGLRRRIARLATLGLLPAADGRDGGTSETITGNGVPERLGPFRLLRRLGGGGMGVVHLARQQGLERDVALKLVRPELLYFDGARRRFEREARAVGALEHPSIVRVFAVGEDDALPWLAMERVEGASLEQLVARLGGRDPASLTGRDLLDAVRAVVSEERRLDAAARGEHNGETPAEDQHAQPSRGAPDDDSSRSSNDVAALFAQSWERCCVAIACAVAEALAHAAAAGVLHRDVKPGNIMVTPAGRVVLLDFGLATARGSARLTATGSLLGSLPYLPPEVVRGETDASDPRTDVYGLGISLYELLGLRAAFDGPTPEHVRGQVLAGQAAPLRTRLPRIAADVDAVVRVAMEPDRERRHADAAHLAADLRRILDRRPVHARPPGSLVLALRAARRHPAMTTAAVFLAVMLTVAPSAWALVSARHAQRLGEALQREGEARRAAERARTEAEASRVRADDQRVLAETHYAWAREAVDAMRAAVDEHGLRAAPGVDGPVRRLRERALAFYERFAAQRPDDPRLEFERLEALRALAELQLQLGRDDEALASFERLARDAGALDDDSAALALAAAGFTGQAALFDRRGDARLAAELHRRSLELRLQRVEASPSQPEARAALSEGLLAVGVRARLDGDLRGAEDAARQAVSLLEDLVHERPDLHTLRLQLVRTRHDLSYTLELRGRTAEAVEQARRMLVEAEPLGITGDDPPSDRTTLALGRHGLAANLARLGELDEAEHVWRLALEELQALADDFPHRPEHARILGAACDGFAALLAGQGREQEARDVQRLGLERLERAATRWPERQELVESWAIALTNDAIAARRGGRHDDARAQLARGIEAIEGLRARGDRPRLRALLVRQYEELRDLERKTGRDAAAKRAASALEALQVAGAADG